MKKAFAIHTWFKYSAGWNLWDQSETAVFLYRLSALWRRLVRKFQSDIVAPAAECWQKGWISHHIRLIRKYWRNLIQPWRNNLCFKDIVESLMFLLVILMPVMKNGYLVTIGLIIYWMVTGSKRWPNGLVTLMGLIIVSAVLNSGYQSHWQNLIELVNGLLIAYIVSQTFTRDLVEKTLRYLVTYSLFLLAIGFWQKWADVATPAGWLEPAQIGIIGPRITSVFGNPNIYAIYLVMTLILSCYLWVETKNLCFKWIWGIITAAGLLSLYFTYSRSAWVIGLIGLGWLLFETRDRYRFYPVLAGIILGTVLILWGHAGARWGTLRNLAGTTLGYRCLIWQGTLKAIANSWLWGTGPGGFAREYPWYQMGHAFADHAHQWYLQFWLEYGILGIIGFVWFILGLFRPFPAAGWPRTIGIAILCFLGFGMVESWYVHSFLNNYFWLLVGIFLVLKPDSIGIDIND